MGDEPTSVVQINEGGQEVFVQRGWVLCKSGLMCNFIRYLTPVH